MQNCSGNGDTRGVNISASAKIGEWPLGLNQLLETEIFPIGYNLRGMVVRLPRGKSSRTAVWRRHRLLLRPVISTIGIVV